MPMPAEGTMVRRREGSLWNVAYSKLRFFRRLLRLINGEKRTAHCEDLRDHQKDDMSIKFVQSVGSAEEIGWSEPMNFIENGKPDDDGVEQGRIDAGESKMTGLELRQAVKQIHFGCPESKWKAAYQIQMMARDNVHARKYLALLGVIPPLVAMLDSPVSEHQLSALQALIHLSNGNYTNKALVVEAGGVAKLGKLLDTSDPEMQEHIAVALLAISALGKNKSIIGSSVALPSLVCMLESGTAKGRMASLAALYNLSTCLENVDSIVRVGAIQPLLKMVQTSETAEISLAILGNLMLTEAGRKGIERVMEGPKCLIDVLGSEKSSRCQERAAYILMVLAHRSLNLRQAMAQAGIVPVLLEVALLGSPLAQKRAMRILQCLKGDAGTATMAVSGPLSGEMWDDSGVGSPHNINMTQMKGHKRAVKTMVKQSLHINMELIMKRADLPSSSVDSSTRLKSLINSSSSKSLPY